MKTKKIKCCFCKKPIEDIDSNNAEPVMAGRCCITCNNDIVIPIRLLRVVQLRAIVNELQ